VPPPLRELEHERRAARHRTVGTALIDAGDEWGAVPLFYCAYHLLKAAMLVDPIWHAPGDLHKLHTDLIADDRFTDRHKGRRRPGGGPKEWGINDLVMLLYRPMVRDYEVLHQASVTVRYGAGLPADVELSSLVDACDRIAAAYAAGSIAATPPA